MPAFTNNEPATRSEKKVQFRKLSRIRCTSFYLVEPHTMIYSFILGGNVFKLFYKLMMRKVVDDLLYLCKFAKLNVLGV